jgi:hypothetical protein
MGAWGTGIFSDDTACDVRDAWREALLDGLDDEAATIRVLHEFGHVFADEDEVVVGWTALAAAQMKTGRLLPMVRERTLEIIDAGGDVESWRLGPMPALARPREKALRALAEKLRGPQPAPKTLKRPKPRYSPLDVGDVVHVRGEDAQGLFVVVGLAQTWSPPGNEPVLAELLWDGGDIPDVEGLKRLPLLHEDDPGARSVRREVMGLEPAGDVVDGPVQHFQQVTCPSRGKYALANYGEVVAKGVLRPDAADHLRDQSRGFDDGPSVSGGGWDTLAAFMTGPWHDRMVETTRRVYGL